ncbi:MAG TPA: 30S ribosomal protein S20 [Alphaproteobacteria bacterium]
MANIKSAIKRIRTSEKAQLRNQNSLSRVRTFIKKVEKAVQSGDAAVAASAFQTAVPELHRATTKGVLHKNTVARQLSRLSGKVKKLQQAA